MPNAAACHALEAGDWVPQTYAGELLADPRFFLHRIDPAADLAMFLPVTRERLRGSAFLDGRTEFAGGPPLLLSLSDALDAAPGLTRTIDRFIFHVSFCGSTLLARLLDRPQSSLVLREPNCLVDLADWKALQSRAGRTDARFAGFLDLARVALGSRWARNEAVSIKPSSWVNNLLDDLVADRGAIAPIFVTMKRQAFVRAVLRGGRDRLAFTARLAAHLAGSVPRGETMLQQAIAASADPLGKAANLAVLAHHFQLSLFANALERAAWGQERILDFDEISKTPFEAAVRANRLLGLGLSWSDIQRTVLDHAGRHSKVDGAAFSFAGRKEEDDRVSSHHEALIAAAVRWGDEALDELAMT